jgi:fibronectin-binding autotransporter adhesin
MIKTIQIKAVLSGAIILATLLFASMTSAAVIVQTVNQTGADANGWASAIWGTPAAVANNSNSYETTNTFAVRTPNNATPAAFAGTSLTIDTGGILYLKHTGGAASVNLIMNGGKIIYHGGPTTANSPLAGTLQVIADSTITTDQTSAGNNRDIWLQSALSGSANLTVTMIIVTNAVILSGNNSAYSGNWTNTSGFIQIANGATNALGSGTVILTGSGTTALVLNSTNNFVISNTISGPGYIVKLNTNMVTLSGNNPFTGSVRITNGVIQLGVGSAISNASAVILAGGVLDASLIGGFTLNAGISQNMNCNGKVIGGLAASTPSSLNFNLTAATNDILNVTGALTLTGNPTLNLTLSGYKPGGIYRLINYSGTIQGGGSFNLIPPAGSPETFALDTNTPGQVNLMVTGVSHNLIWVGDNSANNWDTSSQNWTGDTNVFSPGDNVTFNDSGSTVPDINLNAVVNPSSMTVSNNIEQYIFDGSGISTPGTLTKSGTNELDFTSPGNNFTGPVIIQSGILSIGVGGSLGSLGAPSSITNNGVLRVNLASGGQTFSGPISGSGSLEDIGGGNTVSVRGTNSYTGLTTIGDGCQLNITTSTALGTTNAGTIVLANGRLGVAALVGSMTVFEPLVVNGIGVSAAPGALYVNTVGNNVTWAGTVTIASDSRFRAVNNGVQMNFSNTVLGTNVALECSAGSAASDTATAITFQNTLSLGSGGTLTTDGQGMVVLAGHTNLCGSTTINAGTLLVNGLLDGGAVTVNNTATVGGTGAILGPVSVQDGGSLAPGSSGIGTLTLSNSLTLSGLAVTLMEINRTNTQNSDLLVTASVPFNGTLTVTNIGPALQPGDTFHLFAGAINGIFAATNLPTFGSPGFYWDTSLLASQGTIKVASTAAPAPTISSPAVSGTNFSLQVAASAIGFNYVLQATPVLVPAAWTDIQTNAGNGGTLNFTNVITPGTPQQFFRINVR